MLRFVPYPNTYLSRSDLKAQKGSVLEIADHFKTVFKQSSNILQLRLKSRKLTGELK